jgi:hypothetical protein
MDEPKTTSRRNRRRVVTSLIIIFILLATTLVIIYFEIAGYWQSPLDRLARRFGRIDGQGLHWRYEAMLKTYEGSRDPMYRRQLLDLMVRSRAVHLVPRIIDSMASGGDVEHKMRAIISLTGHDFSSEFDGMPYWQKREVDRAVTRLRQWWAENGQQAVEAQRPKGPFRVPNNWPSLTLSLVTEKPRYLELEPIRLTAILENRSDTWYAFRYRRPRAAFKLEFFRVGAIGGVAKISETRYPRQWIICGSASRWFALPDYFVIEPGSSHVTQQWVNSGYENSFAVGEVTLRAVLTPLQGKDKGRQLISNDIRIEMVKPQGEDAAAHQFLIGTQAVDVGDGQKLGPEFVRLAGLIRNSGSSYDSDIDKHFIRTYGRSVYAYYVRYTQADVARSYAGTGGSGWPPSGTYSEADTVLVTRLKEILQDAPRDFPLLPDACVALLDYYKKTGELEKMEEVAQSLELDALPMAHPRLSWQLVDLMKYPQAVAANVHRKDALGRTSLHKAVENGPPALVLFLLAKGADANAVGNEQTPLFLAAKAGRNRLIEVLLAYGAGIKAKSSGVTPLFWPIHDGRIDTVRLLLAKGAEVNVTDNSGRTPFEWAIRHRRLEIARLLAETRGADGKTPLHWAVEHGRKAMVYDLLKNGARIDATDDAGRTPWDIAESQANKDSRAMAIFLLLKEYVRTR